MDQNNDLTIGGVKIKFPKKPYPCQISLMGKLIKGLQKKENCLLESPTGSGKTLSLLCSALAWQKMERENVRSLILDDMTNIKSTKEHECNCKKTTMNQTEIQSKSKNKRKGAIEYEDEDKSEYESESTYDSGGDTQSSCTCHESSVMNDDSDETPDYQKPKRVPKIYYCTRTHKQITQVVRELKRTPYANETRMTILASRNHMCIHPQISKLNNKDDLCKKLNKDKTHFDEGHENENNLTGGCEFLRRLKKQPVSYENYGFKQSIWDIEDLLVAFKKKRFCPYFGSRDLAPIVDIIFCPYNYLIDPSIRSALKINLNDQIVIVDEAHNIEDSCRESTTFKLNKFQLELAVKELREMLAYGIFQKDILPSISYFIQVFENLMNWIDKNTANLHQQSLEAAMSKIWNGFEIVSEFKMQGIGPDNFELYKRHHSNLSADDQEEELLKEPTRILISQIELILECMFMHDHEFMDDFKVAITKTKLNEFRNDDENSLNISTQFKSTQLNKWTYTVNFWCMNPAVAFYGLKNCHSVILASGTLSPMDTFQSELGTKFEHQLEANHVIADKQVWVGSLGYGPTDVNLLATYKFTDTVAYQDEIGRLILDICKVIPYGVLCFLPSYSLLNKLFNRWSDTRLFDQIGEYKKVFNEAKIAKTFDQLLKDYYDCIDLCSRLPIDDPKARGGLLLAVYRGRASEGLDFSDNYARAVIAVGIPYPNVKDVQVDLKRKYNNNLLQKKNLLSGDEWYEIQAYRAVNQALGRCIRHRNDWGAIILVDDRYFRQPQKYSKGLSKWIRNRFQTYRNYNDALLSLKEFSKQMVLTAPSSNDSNLVQSSIQHLNDGGVEIIIDLDQTKSTASNACDTSSISNYFTKLSSNDENQSSVATKRNNRGRDRGYRHGQQQENHHIFNVSKVQKTKQSDSGDCSIIELTDTNETMVVGIKTSTQAHHHTRLNVDQDDRKKTLNLPFVSPIKPETSKSSSPTRNGGSLKRKIEVDIKKESEQPRFASSPALNAFKFQNKASKFKKIIELRDENDVVNETVVMVEDDEDDYEADFKKKPKQSFCEELGLEEASENNSNKLKCCYCNFEVCGNLSDSPGEQIVDAHPDLLGLLPRQIAISAENKRILVIGSEINKQMVENGTELKQFVVNQSGHDVSDPIVVNSFLDETNCHCWQYYTCKQCLNVIALVLRCSNLSDSKFFELYKNKFIFIT